MNIDNSNFSAYLKNILRDIEQCDFIAFDGEFSGLKTVRAAHENEFQSEEELYQRTKDTCINFSLLQLGLCMFKYDKAYYPTCYNFFLKNNTATSSFNNLTVGQVDCLEFLARNKMDFSRLYQKGITSTRLCEKQHVLKKCINGIKEYPRDFMCFSKKDQALIDRLTKIVQDFRKGMEKSIVLDFENRAVYHEVKARLNLQLEKTEKMGYFEYILLQKKGKNVRAEKVEKAEEGKVKSEPAKQETKQTKESYPIQKYKLEENQTKETEAYEPEKKTEDQERGPEKAENKADERDYEKASTEVPSSEVSRRIEETMGVTLIIEHIVKLRKPIIGHYATLDTGFLYHTFIDDLPDTFPEFCDRLTHFFPFIFDTKVVSMKVQKSLKSLRMDLTSLFYACYNSKLLKPYANIDLDKYNGEETRHEAGYDAFVTGCAFVAMMNYLRHHDHLEKEADRKLEGKQKTKKYQDIHLDRIDLKDSPFNLIVFSKASKEWRLDGKSYRNFDEKVVIIEGSVEDGSKALAEYGTLRVVVKGSVFACFEEPQDVRKIIAESKAETYKLVHFQDRKQFRARKFFS